MSLDLLTIVIPTRDRPESLEKCLRSVFEQQTVIPQVIVSDNSVSEHPAIVDLQNKYRFAYVRQSGGLDQTSHFNICMLELPSSQWVLLLHDDDELYSDSLRPLETVLSECNDVGMVVAGIQHIDQHDKVTREWLPKSNGMFRGDEGLLLFGLDAGACPSGTIYKVAASRQAGGFTGINGIAADYLFGLQLAYSHGVAFLPEIVGRYRTWPQNIFPISTPKEAEAWVDFTVQLVELIPTTGCSSKAADQIIDYMMWWIFLMSVPYCYQPDLWRALRLTAKCLRASPRPGEWQNRARTEHPCLFWRPQWLARLFFCSPILRMAKMFPVQTRRRLRDAISSLLTARET